MGWDTIGLPGHFRSRPQTCVFDRGQIVMASDPLFSQSVKRVVGVIRDCPEWLYIDTDDVATRAGIVRALLTIAQEPTDVLRDATARMADYSSPSANASDVTNTLFLL